MEKNRTWPKPGHGLGQVLTLDVDREPSTRLDPIDHIRACRTCTARLRAVLLFLDLRFDDLRNEGHEEAHGFLNFLITVPEILHDHLHIATGCEKV